MFQNNLTHIHPIHNISPETNNSSLQFFNQNIGGINISEGAQDTGTILQLNNTHYFDSIAISKINLNTTKYHVQEHLHQKVQTYQGSKLYLTSSSLPAPNTLKLGGTIKFSNGKHTGCFIKGYTDDLDQWVTQTYLRKNIKNSFSFSLIPV